MGNAVPPEIIIERVYFLRNMKGEPGGTLGVTQCNRVVELRKVFGTLEAFYQTPKIF